MKKHTLMLVFGAALIVLLGWFGSVGSVGWREGFTSGGTGLHMLEPVAEVALSSATSDPTLLGDVLPLAGTGSLTEFTAQKVAELDMSRITEPVSQYAQRTNNYRHTYPDNGSAPLSEFVGSIYRPSTAVGVEPM